MKKSITAILTGIFALGIAFGASGCKQPDAPPKTEPPKEPDYSELITETAPYYTSGNPSFSDYNWDYKNMYYDDFINYLNDNVKPNIEEAFYLWTPGDAGFMWYGEEYNSEGYNYLTIFDSFQLHAELNESTGALKNPKTLQNIKVYSVDWKDYKNSNDKACVQMTIITQAVDCAIGELSVGFGEYKESVNNYMFANVYVGEVCVATCTFYWDNEKITLKWCENYLKSHLYLWG